MTTTIPERELSREELTLLQSLQLKKARHQPFEAYVTTTQEIPYGSKEGGNGPWNGDYLKLIPAGTTMRVVMVSRLGDFGLSDNLNAEYGYGIRFDFNSSAITNLRARP